MHVSALNVYPVKSCAGIALQQAEVGRRGILYDREWMVVQAATGLFLTQREYPRMALIKTALTDSALQLSMDGTEAVTVPFEHDGPRREVVVWRSTCDAIDQGDAVAAWLSDTLDFPCRLVRMAPEHVRHINPAFARRPDDQTGFADGYPFLLIGQASLDDLNSRLPAPLPMNRFRPNIVVEGSAPYAEDGWRRIQVSELGMDSAKPCVRCPIPTTDQETAMVGKEPLTTLATYRRVPDGVIFGMNLIHDGPGELRVGDSVQVLA